MLTSVHLLTGAVIGKATGNLWIAAVLSFAFHHVLDAIPHYNPKSVKGFMEGHIKGSDKRDLFLKSLEPSLAIVITIYLITMNPADLRISMIVGAIFGWLPDLFVFLDWKFKNRFAELFSRFEKRFHHHASFLPGILSQVIISLIAILILL